ncbi:hypothetical protein HPB48_011499 [Haemaphysalis longicornis]|uniref:BZIP domain-containing protein n=1 Tax=Haemaphysalis longicornis TaxID=44386 RepID=A0A9J6GJ09_HAELO|nr:hypothetical protein HPB48_011499 [Haemaphysalis longicornis]
MLCSKSQGGPTCAEVKYNTFRVNYHLQSSQRRSSKVTVQRSKQSANCLAAAAAFSGFTGITSGIPTRTTATLTPTTLKNIEESFMELQSVPPAPMEHQHQAGFVPPLSPEEEERRRIRRERNKLAAARCRKRRMDHTNSLLKETEGLEETRSSLQKEIAALRHEKENLEFILKAHEASCKAMSHIKAVPTTTSAASAPVALSQQRPQHLPVTSSYSSSPATTRSGHKVPATPGRAPKFSRPNSLPVTSIFTNLDGSSALNNNNNHHNNNTDVPVSCAGLLTEVAGVPIQTPSAGMYSFESIVEGTGATPTGTTPLVFSPVTSCAEQQRNTNGDISSPDAMNPPKLVSL